MNVFQARKRSRRNENIFLLPTSGCGIWARHSQNRETLCVCVNARTCRGAASKGAVKTQTHGGKHLENTEESVDRAWC